MPTGHMPLLVQKTRVSGNEPFQTFDKSHILAFDISSKGHGPESSAGPV